MTCFKQLSPGSLLAGRNRMYSMCVECVPTGVCMYEESVGGK